MSESKTRPIDIVHGYDIHEDVWRIHIKIPRDQPIFKPHPFKDEQKARDIAFSIKNFLTGLLGHSPIRVFYYTEEQHEPHREA